MVFSSILEFVCYLTGGVRTLALDLYRHDVLPRDRLRAQPDVELLVLAPRRRQDGEEQALALMYVLQIVFRAKLAVGGIEEARTSDDLD